MNLIIFLIIGMMILNMKEKKKERNEKRGRKYIIEGDKVVIGKKNIRMKGIKEKEIGKRWEGEKGKYDWGGEDRNKLRERIGRE